MPTMRARVIAWVLLALAAGALPPAAEDPPPPDSPAEESPPPGAPASAQAPTLPGATPSGDARAESGLARALAWLALAQAKGRDGSMPAGHAVTYVPIGSTALAALAFMAGGNAPDRGPHGAALGAAVDYLVAHCDLAPNAPARGYVSEGSDTFSRMHGHGFAAHALAEAWCMSARSERGKRVGEALAAAVELIERTQGADGGWFYEPARGLEHEGSVTICLVQALRAARNAGVTVSADVIARAEDYVLRSQAEDGTFRYTLGSDRTTVALTAAAVATLNMAGRYDTPAIGRGIDAIWRRLTAREGGTADDVMCPFYERLYLAQAFWQLSDRTHFERWYAPERERVLAAQREDGSWSGSPYGEAYATAVNALFLALPQESLPTFRR